jgi:hypothetical protein
VRSKPAPAFAARQPPKNRATKLDRIEAGLLLDGAVVEHEAWPDRRRACAPDGALGTAPRADQLAPRLSDRFARGGQQLGRQLERALAPASIERNQAQLASLAAHAHELGRQHRYASCSRRRSLVNVSPVRS